ncbi:MAG: alpha/beta hydrolase family esterase [Rhizobiaceae bacterium]
MKSGTLPFHGWKDLSRHQFFSICLLLIATNLLLIGTDNIKVTAAEQPCIGDTPCPLGDRSYHVLPPDNWDGKTRLPVLLYFHGWGRQGPVPLNHKHIGGATRKTGVLLIAPNGLGKSWDFWRPGSRDTEFAKEVLADVEESYPLDRSKLFVSGYSWGSSMAWRFSCEAGDQVSVLLGISGTFYDQNEECKTGPVEVRHVHGLTDTVMDFPYGPNGEETGPVHLWARTNGCGPDPDEKSSWKARQTFTHYAWKDCKSGKSISLDVHGGGHWIAKHWMAKQLKELLNRKSSS